MSFSTSYWFHFDHIMTRLLNGRHQGHTEGHVIRYLRNRTNTRRLRETKEHRNRYRDFGETKEHRNRHGKLRQINK